MAILNLNPKRILAGLLSFAIFLMYSAPLPVMATVITNISPSGANNNVYNIEAAKVHGHTGFRHYTDFTLDKGDIANLLFKKGNQSYSNFVNLVSNKITINGIVNTMKGNNFYNGHAIFVSPLGFVVGSSGVLNVGSLSVLTPSQSKFDDFKSKYDANNLADYIVGADKYKELLKDSHGTVDINGKILSRGDVELYGDTINIKGTSSDKAGIIAGIGENEKTVINAEDTAKVLFDNLVQNNIKETTNFALENGKVKIVAGFKEYTGEGDNKKPDGASNKAEITIENAQIGGDEIEIKANSTKDGTYILANTDEAISSKIDIINSDITGNDIDIAANSESVLSRNINITVPTVLLWIFDSDAHLDEYFSEGVYTGFEGVRTKATVTVKDSVLNALDENLSIEASSSSETKIGSQVIGPVELSQFVPAIFYGYGTQTESKIEIVNSTLKAKKDVDLNAFSSNVLSAKVADECVAGINLKMTDAYNLAFMKNSAIADTKITIDNSTVEGKNVSMQSLAYNEMDNRVLLKTRIGKNDFQDEVQGGSSASLAGILNATDIKSSIEVKNNSKVTATEDVEMNAYNINDVSNWVDAEVTDPLGYTNKWEESDKWLLKQFDRLGRTYTAYDQITHFTIKDFKDKFTKKGQNIYSQVWPEDKQTLANANFQAGAGVVWNSAKTTNNVIISNSTIKAKNISIKAHTVDATVNETDAYAEEDANWGGAFALVVNKQTNNNKVDVIDSSKLTAEEDLSVDSIVELPAQQGTFGLSTAGLFGVSFTLGLNFGMKPNDEWDFGFHKVGSEPTSEKIVPEIGLFGFYNNFAAASAAGDKASISGAVIYNQLNNNSDINITNSELKSTSGDITMNSVVSASAHDAVDFFNYDGVIDIAKGIKTFNKWNSESGNGGGGAVLVQNFTQNARITVDNSTLESEEGDVKLNTAAEQSYLNLVTPGGKAETIGINGAVSVQKVHGTTGTTVKNGSELTANNISIDSGKVNVQFTKKGSDMGATGLEFLNDDDEVVLAEARDAKDHITAVALNGTFTKQSEESTAPTSQGAAFGASVIVQNIDRVVKSLVDNSTLTAGNIDIKSESYTRNIFVTLAGSFAGGVSPSTDAQEQANAGGGGAQEMQNVGNWMDILDNAQPDDDDILGLQNLFNENNPNQQGANNAQQHANDINNQNAQVNNDGNINNNNGGNNPGNNNGNMANNAANPGNATSNFSLALAGSVSVVYDESKVESVVQNSTVNVEKELNVTSDRDHFMLNASGGITKSGTVGGGAAVNVYTDKGGAKSLVDNSKIIFTSDEAAKKVNVTADDKHYIVNVGVGVGISGGGSTGGDSQKFDAAIGGSFNTNRLLGTSEAKITNNSEIKNDFKKDEDGNPTTEIYSNDIDVRVQAKGDTTIWNTGGDAGIATGGSSAKFQLGAAVAGNMNFLEQKINSEISNSTLTNVKNVDIISDLDQKINAISVAAAVTQRSDYSFNLEGALGLEFIKNSVTALLKDSTVSSSGDVKLLADSDIEGQTLTGDITIEAGKGIGVGIGVVLGIDNSTVSSKIDGGTISKAASIESKANSVDNRKFLAVNLGLSDSSYQILTNGVVNIYKTTVESKVINNANLTSIGAVNLLSNYENSNQGITAIAEKTQNSLAFGANILASSYANTVKSELENGSKILNSGSVRIDAGTSEKINYIPAALAIATGHGSSVAADIVVNVIKNNTYANVYGNVTTLGKFVVKALDDTTVYERGGVLAYSGEGTVGIGSIVYFDYLNKTVQAEVKDNTVYAGDATVQATAVNSFGGTKKEDGTWDVSDMSTSASDYGANFHENSSFKNWTMAYSLAHGDSAGASGAVVVRVLDDIIKANVEGVTLGSDDKKASSLTIYANDYTIMNTIAGQFTPSDLAGGGNAIFAFSNTDVKATLTGGTQILTGDLSIEANSEKVSHTVLVGGSGADKVAVNGAVFVNKTTDKVTSSLIGSTVTANKVTVDSKQKNDSLGVDVSVAGSGKFSLGGILYLNLYNDTTKALVGDNDKARTTINSTGDIEVNSDSDYEAREYLLSVGASGKIGVSGLGIANVMDATIESRVYNSDVTSSNGKLDVNAYRWFNKGSVSKTAFFRNWFKGTDAYAKQNTQITSSDLSGMAPIVGALNVSAGGTGAGSGTIVVNKARGTLTSKIDNSTVLTQNGAKVSAQQNFTNFDAVAAVAGSAHASLNGVGVINSLAETVTAEVSNSTVSKGSITTDAQSNMNLNQLVVSGQGAGVGAAIGVVVDSNNIEDKVYSYIISTTAEAGAGANSAHNIMINNIMLAGGGVGQGLSANVAVVLNKFLGAETFSKIDGSTVNGGDINLTSFDNLDNLSAIVGVSAAGQGANLSGYAIRNELGNKSKSFITNSTINTTGRVNIFADSVISTTNALFSAGIVGQGASILANVISNTITSEVEGYIQDSTIKKSGKIKITANVNNDTNKYRYDEMTNTTGNVSFAGQGAALATNVIYTNYSNTVKSYIENTSSDSISYISLDSNSERRLDNINVGIGGAAMGAAVAVNAISTTIDTETSSYIDAKSKTMDKVGAINVYSRDDSDIKNTMGTVQIAGIGAAAGVALDMTWNNALVKSEILSNSGGQINASSANLKSENILEYGKTNVGVSLGAVGLAGDYVLIKSGKRSGNFTQSEKDSGIETVISKIDSKYLPATTPSEQETGSIAQVGGNLKTSGNISINAESKIKGRGNNEELSLTNVTVTAGLGAGSVGVKDVDLASNTFAGITGGTVESTAGSVSTNAKSTSNVKIKAVDVRVSGIGFAGGSSMYANTSKTTAEIKDATVKANSDVNVVSESVSKSIIDAVNVVVSLGDIVAVDLAENKDTNSSVALVTGNTNIDTKGKLNIHSTASTDLESTKVTVKVQGVGFVNVSKNEVNASTICSAVIKNVTGAINTHGLDITTDYGKMYTLSKSNVIAVTLGGFVNTQSSGATMNATFSSGIDSPTGLVLKNTGATNITTAKDKGTDGLVSKGEIYNVAVSLVQFAAVSSANAINTATSATLLNANDFTTDSLTINSYLNSMAKAEATGTKVDLAVGVNSVSASSKDTSTMSMVIGGNNTINGTATINANHTANTHSDLSAFGFSLLASGGRIRVSTELIANTTGNIGGNFNANQAAVNMNTTRNSHLSKSSGNGALLVAVNDAEAKSDLTGSSTLTVSNMNTDSSVKNNNLTLKNTSTNTMDIKSNDGSGAGLIAVSKNKTYTTFNTSTTTNITNSHINSNNNVGFEVSNNAIIKDSAKSGAGGLLVAVADTEANNTYTSNAKLSLQNSTIDAKGINLKTSSDIRTPQDVMVDYKGGAGGFIAENEMKLTNTMNQTSEIELINSQLYSSGDIVLKVLTSSSFRQKTDSTVGGFTAMPRSKNWLNVTNNNKVSLDAVSKLKATDELEIDFDSNNTLEARAISEAHHFGFRDPVAESYITLTVNNTLNNNGSIEAGNLVDVNYMTKSTNNLTQYAYSEAHAAIPTTTENGQINKTVNNTLKVRSGADITSGKDVEILYSTGGGSTSSYINWKAVCYALFGIPIPKNGTPKSKISNVHTPKLEMEVNGKIVAGQGNSKYMKINRDGTVDKETLKGFYDDDYTLSDGAVVPGSVVKQKTLDSIRIEITNAQNTIDETESEITAVDKKIEDLNFEKSNFEEQLGEINGLIGDGYTLKSNDDFSTMVINDIKNIVINDTTAPVTESDLNTVATAYNALANYIEEYNGQHPSETISVPTISEFFNKIDTYDNSIITDAQKTTIKGLSNEQRTTVQNGYNTVLSRMSITEKGKFTVYKKGNDEYVSVTNPTGTGASQTCDEITSLTNEIDAIVERIAPYIEKRSVLQETKTASVNQKDRLQNTYEQVENTPDYEYEQRSGEYSIVFNNIYSHAAHITISGASSINIYPQGTNGGTFSVASSGLQIDNYSTRTVVFNDISLDNAVQSGLIIDGKNFNKFADEPQAVSGWDAYHYVNNNWIWPSPAKSFEQLETQGVHYVSGSGGITGITVNNYYDVLNPFASSQTDVPFNTLASDIYFTGDIKTSANFTVWNESGNIGIITDEYEIGGKTTLIASQGAIGIVDYNENDNYSCNKITLKSGDRLFAGDTVELYSKDFDIAEGVEINSGYSNRNITITNEMLNENNLIVDPVTGEKNLVNLGGEFTPYTNATNNIKVIYKNNKLYLFDIKDTESGVDIGEKLNSNASEVATGTATGTISANANIHAVNGYRTITIDNQSDKELVVRDITNAKNTGAINVKVATDHSNKSVTNIPYSTTTITSEGKLTLGGIIRNCVQIGIPDYVLTNDNGTLQITANNGLDINPQRRWDSSTPTPTMEDYDSIYAKGGVDITVNNGDANINGSILDKGILRITKNGSGDMKLASNITDENGSVLITTNDSSNTNITGDIECSGDISGGVDIVQQGTGKLEISSNIDVDILKYKNEDEIDETVKGNLRITTCDTSNLTIDHSTVLSNMNGGITIQNSGSDNSITIDGIIFANGGPTSVTINTGAATYSEINAEIYSIGNVEITNTDSGSLTISNVIAAIDGNITVRELFKGSLTIADTAEIINYSEPEYDANGNLTKTYGIYITNEFNDGVDNLDISGNIYNYGGGVIEITNNGSMGAYIGGNVYNDIGNINITNNNDMLHIAGEITANKGSINITNNGAYGDEQLGIRITNKINGTDGNITITNTKGSFEIKPSTNESSAAISLNTTDGSSGNTGSIYINNGENAGPLELSDKITNGGVGSIVINNQSTTGATVIKGDISNNVAAEDGIGISIRNVTGFLDISGDVKNNKGSVGISNSGTKVEIAKLIENKEGNTTIEATKGDLIVGANAKIINNKDNVDKSSAILLTVGENGGNIITSGEITNYGTGDIEIINNGASGTDDTGTRIGGTISNANGNITISNANKGLTVSDNISNTKGHISISNAGGEGALLDGIIAASDGNITITNTNDGLSLLGEIYDDKGNISISNSGGEGALIDGIVEASEGDITIANTNDGLSVLGDIYNDKGNISISNSGGEGALIDGNVEASDGNITITNTNDAIAITGYISDDKGNITISNSGDNGSVISGIVQTYEGDVSFENTKGGANIDGILLTNKGNMSILNHDGVLFIDTEGAVYNLSENPNTAAAVGEISIANDGTDDTVIFGDVYTSYGKIDIINSNKGELYIDGSVENEYGNINISNVGEDGTNVSGSIIAKIGDIEIKNTADNLTVAGNISNTEKGGIYITNGTNAETNAGVNMQSTALITANEGNVNLTNYGTGKVQLGGSIINQDGNTSVINKGNHLVYTGEIDNTNGGVNIINDNGVVHVHGNISNKGGDINIANSGSYTEITGVITNATYSTSESSASGSIHIANSDGHLRIMNTAKITNTSNQADDAITIANAGNILNIEGSVQSSYKGDIEITNTGNGKASISGEVYVKEGDIDVSNSTASDKLTISGLITDDKGGILITNGSANGAEISGTILDKEGNVTVTNNDGVFTLTQTGTITDNKGGVNISNTAADKGTVIAGGILANLGDVTLTNAGDSLAISGSITDDKGDITITNNGVNGTEISGTVLDKDGNLNISNANTGANSGIRITTSGLVSDTYGDMRISNVGKQGITVEGLIRGNNANVEIENTNSDITIGEYTSANDKYIGVSNGNVLITQTNGDILNGIVDPSNSTHSNYDLGNPNHAYKTLISTTNDLTLDVENGDIGVTSSSNPGYGIDATTRDYTDSINVNIGGSVVAKALNSDANSTDVRLINLRAKESDLTIKDVVSDGNIILTSADWKQADIRPVPDPESEKPEDVAYYTGYSILAVPSNSGANLAGQNISVISSNNIGTENNKLVYQQDSVKAPNSSVSFEAENDINLTGKATPGGNIRINHLVTKRGSIDFDMESDAEIIGITAGKGLKLTQKAQNLTIRNLGLPGTEGDKFQDMLNPHDDLVYGDGGDPSKTVVPNYVNIKVLDAIDTPERSESNLNIYTAYVKGNHGKNTHYYPDGSRLADVTLMADNIYAASFIAPDSKVSTKANPNGVKVGGGTYTNTDIDPTDTNVYVKKGINSYGSGEAISVDILGVDEDVVNDIVPVAQRNKYGTQTSKTNIPEIFKNKEDRTKLFDYDFKADNVYLSVNDYATENRGVSIDTVYAKNAYINTHDTNLSVQDGFINNYAEFRNASKLAVVDNDYRRTVKSDMQLYTAKTGSFAMGLSNSTIMKTTAPVVDFNPYHLVNGYSSENSFVNLTFKETSLRQKEKNLYQELNKKTDYYNKSVSLVFNTLGQGILPDTEIYEISRTGAVIDANDLKVGQGVNVKLKFNDIDIGVESKVKEIHGNKATVEFLNISDEVSNQIMYEYMKKINSMRNSISSL